jgi:hypothetical protein
LLAIAAVGWPVFSSAQADFQNKGGHSFETLHIMAASGSSCRLKRAGVEIAAVRISGVNGGHGMSDASVDTTASHEPIEVVCSIDGQKTVARTYAWEPDVEIHEGPQCRTPPSNASEVQVAEARTCQNRRAWASTTTEYPDLMRVFE